MNPFTAIGVDVGGTKIAAGLVTFPEGVVRGRRQVPTRPERGGDAVLQEVEDLVSGLIDGARAGGQAVAAIGLGVCELVGIDGGVMSENCFPWLGGTVSERLSKFAPTVVEADVRAAARAEALFGAGRAVRVFLYVTLGTGIASCLVIGGEPFTGSRGATGTLASGPLPQFEERGGEAFAACLEQWSAGPALVARFNALGGAAHSAQDVFAAARAGHAAATQIVRSAAATLGASIGVLVNVLDPDRVILGGGLGLSEGIYRDTLIAAVRSHIWWAGHRDLAIVAATTGSDAGVIGAAATAWKTAARK